MHHGLPNHYSSCWKTLQGIDWFRSSNFTSLIFHLSTDWWQFQDPYSTHHSKIKHNQWFIYDSLRHDNSTFVDIRFQIHPQLCDLWYRIYFGIDIQKKFSLSYTWDKEKNCYIQRGDEFLNCTKTVNRRPQWPQLNHHLKYHHGHSGVVPIKITGLVNKEHMAYFITDDNSTKGRDPIINIINGIHKN